MNVSIGMQSLTKWIGPSLIALILLGTGMGAASAQVIHFDQSDPAIRQATLDARATLPLFFEQSRAVDPGNAMLKIAVPHADGTEHIWMRYCRAAQGSALTCLFSNDPEYIPYKIGDAFTFGLDIVSDWMWVDGQGLIHGNYTLRAMLPRLPADQAEGLRAQLAPLPN